MSDWSLAATADAGGGNPMIANHRTNPITETGIVVYNGKQDGDEIKSRGAKIGQFKIGDIVKNFPGDLVFTRAGRKPLNASRTNPLPPDHAVPAWSAFNGVTDEPDLNFRLVGEARTTNQLQGMQGRELDRAFAIKAGGISTILLNSVLPVPDRAVLMWTVPRSPGLRADYAGHGRQLAEIKEWKASECVTNRLVMHSLIKKATVVRIDPAKLSNAQEVEQSQALIFGRSVNVIGFNAVVTYERKRRGGVDLTPDELQTIAADFGIISHNQADPDFDRLDKEAKQLQSDFIDVVFQARFNPKTHVSTTNPELAAFRGPEASLVTGRQRDKGNTKQKEVVRQQLTAVTNITSSLCMLIESKKQQIFAIALRGANPFQPIDIHYVV
jgi:hypothetical protein